MSVKTGLLVRVNKGPDRVSKDPPLSISKNTIAMRGANRLSYEAERP